MEVLAVTIPQSVDLGFAHGVSRSHLSFGTPEHASEQQGVPEVCPSPRHPAEGTPQPQPHLSVNLEICWFPRQGLKAAPIKKQANSGPACILFQV